MPGAPGAAPRQQHRDLVGIGARLDEQRAAERWIDDLGDARGEPHLGHVVVDRAGVGEGARGLIDGACHARVVVAQRRTHLAGVEVEVLAPLGIPDQAALRAGEDRALLGRHDIAEQTVVNEVARGQFVQLLGVHIPLPTPIGELNRKPGRSNHLVARRRRETG